MAVLRCTAPFAYMVGNTPRVLRAGDVVDADDPCVKGREDKFEPVEVAAERYRVVEQATAAPGEKRTRSRAQKSSEQKMPE